MVLTKVIPLKNNQRITKTPLHEQPWFKLLGKVFSLLMQVSPIERYIVSTASWLDGRTFRLLEQERYVEALELSLEGVKRAYSSKSVMAHYYFWLLMGRAVYCVEVLKYSEIRDRLIALAENGKRPFEGSNVAYCFSYFSRWLYEEGDYDAAVEYAARGSAVDQSLGEPDFLLGWYMLAIGKGKGDPVEHFRAAIRKDHEYLSRVIHDQTCKNFPHILAELKGLQVVENTRRS